MPLQIEHDDLLALDVGSSLLGSGGGGSPRLLRLALERGRGLPALVHALDELPDDAHALCTAFVGSTLLLAERLPSGDEFGALIAAAERWLGARIDVVCSLEGGGMNVLTPVFAGDGRTIVDADLTGRAVPSLDQLSLHVDGVPGIVAACATGAGGVVLVDSGRPQDVEQVIRAAVTPAGGVTSFVLAGFTVGQLRAHAVAGGTARALDLGRRYLAAESGGLAGLATAIGGRLLAEGRVASVQSLDADPFVSVAEIDDADGAVHRLVMRSESLALMTDGVLVSSSPTILVCVDAVSRRVLECGDVVAARPIAVIELPAPDWWFGQPHRAASVRPSFYGLSGLDGAA